MKFVLKNQVFIHFPTTIIIRNTLVLSNLSPIVYTIGVTWGYASLKTSGLIEFRSYPIAIIKYRKFWLLLS